MISSEITGLIILLICIVLFVTNWLPSAVTGCLGCMLFVLTGICPLSSAFSGFSDSIVLLVFGSMCVGIAMFDTGTAQLIGRWVIRVSGNRERVFIFFGSLISGLLSMWLANTAVVAAFLPIIDSVALASDRMKRKNMTIAVTFGAMFGGSCTLIGSTPQLTANGILKEMAGTELTMFQYLPVGLAMFAAFLLYTQLIGYPLGERIWGNRPEEQMRISEEERAGVLERTPDKKKLVLMILVFAAMIISYVGNWIPYALTACLAGILCVILKLTDTDSIKKNLNWDALFLLAACLGIAKGLTEANTAQLIVDVFIRFFGTEMPPMGMFVVLVLTTTSISNFVTNSTAVIIVLPIAISICSSLGYSLIPFALGLVYAANLACCTPIAHAQVSMTLVAGYRFSDYIKYNGIQALITNVLIIILTPLFFPF